MKTRKHTLRSTKALCDKICRCETRDDISRILKIHKNDLALLAFEPMYYRFSVLKSNGKFRQIEAPEAQLKQFQRRLNEYLQAVYFLHQSPAAYGYVMKVKGVKIEKSIKSNASKHLGCKYLLNMDFEDFFHQIGMDKISKIFGNFPFNFNKHTAHTLSRICCYNKRLPMGAPTSPVLSNFYCLNLDKDLSEWAKKKDLVYTRFVDDLSFSSKTKAIETQHIDEIIRIAEQYDLRFNSNKNKLYKAQDVKIVTGLIIDDTVDIIPDYYAELQRDIERLRAVTEVNYITGNTGQVAPLRKFKQEIRGKINFISQIKGKDSEEYIRYPDEYYEALEPAEDLSVRWTKFGNYMTQ